MKTKITFLVLFVHILTFSQIKFEKGYFITNSDERVECYIKNVDWLNNPTSFEYKINLSDNTATNTIKEVKFFEIYNQVQYIRSIVQYDNSSDNVSSLSEVRTPEFIEKEVFLKVLLTGNISLYKLTVSDRPLFFYKTEDNQFQQLIFKRYEIEPNKIAYNNDYKKQLEKVLNCQSINDQEIEKIRYNEKDITNLLIKYYKCSNPNYQEKLTKSNQGKFNLYIRPRLNSSSLEFSNSISSNLNRKMGNKIGFGLGIEAEYVLPFNKNKWAFIAEPTYQNYKANAAAYLDNLNTNQPATSVDYKSIDLPIGIRHYMFLNSDSKIFINVQYVLYFLMDSNIEYKQADGLVINSLKIDSSSRNLAFGIGYTYINKYGIEARFYTKRNITNNYVFWNSDYKNISLILSYNLF